MSNFIPYIRALCGNSNISEQDHGSYDLVNILCEFMLDYMIFLSLKTKEFFFFSSSMEFT
jgi:hypothetical protein